MIASFKISVNIRQNLSSFLPELRKTLFLRSCYLKANRYLKQRYKGFFKLPSFQEIGMYLCDSYWEFKTFSILLTLETNFLKNENEYRSLVESTRNENATFPYKTVLTEANAKSNGMGSTKWTYQKGLSFASNYFIF